MTRAKYIEGLENRLGRMEQLLKLSGLLGREDDDRTDLGTLERRLADQNTVQSNDGTPTRESTRSSNSGSQPRTLPSPKTTPQIDQAASPDYPPAAAPDQTSKQKEEAVEELSDMMCSLVTNNCGETRYIGEILTLNIVNVPTSILKSPSCTSTSVSILPFQFDFAPALNQCPLLVHDH